ncbi:DUF2325 domain-containing protein [Roseiarcaceae bacterium H3SJ34-1]|uniref:DUF2325 domain-containing protein n=1 Tax=Terripilifer ovatus TaxID=3032367 RepID=UPI003AB97A08|nr:DUF2325 domain-containing protein [Roseiarcaceae bacterium H3SJ34-1]
MAGILQFSHPESKVRPLWPNFAVPQPVVEGASAAGCILRQRRKLWDFSTNLHCSIIGTCMTVGELRKIVRKAFDGPSDHLSEHDLHQKGVQLASVHAGPAKLLQKALDARHGSSIRQFEAADNPADVLRLWEEAKKAGDIAGGYWAALTHPQSTGETIRTVFADVHMLSHLVGAANRADIRQLTRLEKENVALTEKVERQEAHLRTMLVERDREIMRLQKLLSAQLTASHAASETDEGDAETLHRLASRLQTQLSREEARCAKLEAERQQWRSEQGAFRTEIARLQTHAAQLGEEVEALEAYAGAQTQYPVSDNTSFTGTLLYIGGQPSSLPSLRDAVTSKGAEFLHHDGGQADAMSLLAGLVGRADIAVFPVDCVSHNAATAVKRLCKQSEKPFVALPRSGVGSLLRTLRATSSSDPCCARAIFSRTGEGKRTSNGELP